MLRNVARPQAGRHLIKKAMVFRWKITALVVQIVAWDGKNPLDVAGQGFAKSFFPRQYARKVVTLSANLASKSRDGSPEAIINKAAQSCAPYLFDVHSKFLTQITFREMSSRYCKMDYLRVTSEVWNFAHT